MDCYRGTIQQGDQNWIGTIHTGKLCTHTPKENSNIEDAWTKYEGYDKFNGIISYRNPEIPIESYNDQWYDNMTSNGMWDVLSLIYPQNQGEEVGPFSSSV